MELAAGLLDGTGKVDTFQGMASVLGNMPKADWAWSDLAPIHRCADRLRLLKRGIGRPLSWEDRSVKGMITQIKEHPIDAIIAQPRPTRHGLRR
jgi:hypothetical protein